MTLHLCFSNPKFKKRKKRKKEWLNENDLCIFICPSTFYVSAQISLTFSFSIVLCHTHNRTHQRLASQMLYWCHARQVFQVSCWGSSPTGLSLILLVPNDALALCFHLSSAPRQHTAEPGEIGSLFFIVIYSVFSLPL